MPKLEVYQSLWAMALRQPGLQERSDEQSFSMIQNAGFSGVCLDPAVHEVDDMLAKQHLFKEFDLKCLLNAFPKDAQELRLLLELAKEMQSPFVNVIGVTYPLTAKAAIPIVESWLDVAEDVGVPILFETHRDCITNDMFFTLELLQAIPAMRLCADLSHYVVNRELRLPLDDFWVGLFDSLLQRSDCFQGRIASHEQIQVPLHFSQHRHWETQFQRWWTQGFSDWQRRAADDDTLIFLCELGPPPYAITGADGRELSDRFVEACQIKTWAENCWEHALSKG